LPRNPRARGSHYFNRGPGDVGADRPKRREYYDADGTRDPLVIEFPFRGYLPVFRAGAQAAEETADPAPAAGRTRRQAPLLAAIAAVALVALGLARYVAVLLRLAKKK